MPRVAFGDVVLDFETREVLRSGEPVPLSPKAFQLLGILVQCRPSALSKGELQDRLWPGTFVVEKNLANLVGEIRGALGDDAANPRFIRTVPRFGYAFRESAPAESVGEGGGARGTGAALSTEVRRHNLPEPVTSFVGREREVAEIVRLLSSTRLLTLTGTGGCGKTRLALEVARRMLDGFPDGVWLAELAPLAEPTLVAQTVASALDIRQAPTRSLVETLSDQLRDRRILLVLDNCEHVIASSADLAGTLLRSASGLTILATSREALGIAGETAWRVPSLTLPNPHHAAPSDDLSQYEAVRLLVERAVGVDSTFTITRDNADAVADVCRRLDGIPLAIELVAARLKVLSIEQISARLDDRFRLLGRTQRTAIERHRTLEAAVDWSYDLLSDAERQLLRRLSTFAGGWTLEAAEQVCAGDGIDSADVLDLMSRLVDKSLVMVDENLGGSRRYRYLETVREYAWNRLRQLGEADAMRARHFRFFLELVQRAEPELVTARQLHWLDHLRMDHDNLRAALDWGLASDHPGDSLELAGRLHWFWLKCSYLGEGQHWLERALARSSAPARAQHAQALMGLGSIAFFQGDFERANRLLEESAALAHEAGEPSIVAITLGVRTLVALESGDVGGAARLAAEAGAAARTAGVPWLECFSMSFVAHEAMHVGDVDRAGHLHDAVLTLLQGQGELWGMGIVLFDLALLRVVQHRHEEARALCADAIALARRFGDLRAIAWCLGVLAGADAAEGRPARAAQLRGAMEGLLDSIGAPVQPTYTTWIGDRYFGAVQQALGAPAYQQALADGRAMQVPQAIEHAFKEL